MFQLFPYPISTDVNADITAALLIAFSSRFLYAAHDSLAKKQATPSSPCVAAGVDPSLFVPWTRSGPSPIVPPSSLVHSLSHSLSPLPLALDPSLDVASWLEAVTPCVLCVTGLEATVNTEASMANKLKTAADKLLCVFVHSLFSHLSAAVSQGRGAEGGIVLIGTTASPLQQLSSEVLEHFPQHLAGSMITAVTTVPSVTSTMAKSGGDGSDDCIAQQIPEHNNEEVETSGHDQTQEKAPAEEQGVLLRAACRAQGEQLGRVHMTHFVQELRMASLQRQHGADWEAQAFRSSSSSSSVTSYGRAGTGIETSTWCGGGSLVLSAEDVSRVQASSQRSGRWGAQQHEGPGSVSGTPVDMGRVHWDDIGGVER